MFEFIHSQLTFLNFVVGGVYLFYVKFTLLECLVLVLFLVTLIYQLAILLPYTFLANKQVASCRDSSGNKTSLSILSANVYMYNKQYAKLKTAIARENPDIISLLEPNRAWKEQMDYLKTAYPYFVEVDQETTYGMLLYSKFEILSQEIRYLVESDVPSIHVAVKLSNDKRVNLHCLHPKPPSPTQNKRSTERDVELLIVAKTVQENNASCVVFGDLNDVAWSRTTRKFQKLSGLLDPRVGRGFFNTFHVKYPFLRWPLDHVFHSQDFDLKSIKRLEDIGSDHFPIFVKLTVKTIRETQTVLSASEETTGDAEVKIENFLEGDIPKIRI